MCEHTKSLLTQLLERNPQKRPDINEIKAHTFFSVGIGKKEEDRINFDTLEKEEGPFKKTNDINWEEPKHNFDKEFTSGDKKLPEHSSGKGENWYENWDYNCVSLAELEDRRRMLDTSQLTPNQHQLEVGSGTFLMV